MTVTVLPFMLLQTSSDDCDAHEGIHEGREGHYRLQVTQFVQRLEYWHKELSDTLLTSIHVAQVHGRAVAYLGTADGRHIQVGRSSLSFLLVCVRVTDGERERKRPEWRKSDLCGKQQLGTNKESEAAVVSLRHCSCKCSRMSVRGE